LEKIWEKLIYTVKSETADPLQRYLFIYLFIFLFCFVIVYLSFIIIDIFFIYTFLTGLYVCRIGSLTPFVVVYLSKYHHLSIRHYHYHHHYCQRKKGLLGCLGILDCLIDAVLILEGRYIHIHIHIHIHIYTYLYVYINIHLCNIYMYIYTYICVYIKIHFYIYILEYINTYIYREREKEMMNKIGGIAINDVDDENQRICSVLCAKFLDDFSCLETPVCVHLTAQVFIYKYMCIYVCISKLFLTIST
jgi:hypothetical protein